MDNASNNDILMKGIEHQAKKEGIAFNATLSRLQWHAAYCAPSCDQGMVHHMGRTNHVYQIINVSFYLPVPMWLSFYLVRNCTYFCLSSLRLSVSCLQRTQRRRKAKTPTTKMQPQLWWIVATTTSGTSRRWQIWWWRGQWHPPWLFSSDLCDNIFASVDKVFYNYCPREILNLTILKLWKIVCAVHSSPQRKQGWLREVQMALANRDEASTPQSKSWCSFLMLQHDSRLLTRWCILFSMAYY